MHLKNFQTYQNADFHFHPQLNFIAGPNGSGKSSIANAIAFVFCGTPSTIGKTKDISEYVNFSANEASVEAIIKYKDKTCILKRVFNKVNKKSIWYVNNTHKKQAEYVLFVESLNVNVDNLCQFLPQEKVSEFASLSSEELLIYTLDSQGDKTIVKLKEELCALERNRSELQSSIEGVKKKREGIGRIVQSLSKDVNRLKEKGKKEDKISLMKLKRKWLVYELLKREFTKTKDDISVFRKEMSNKEQLVLRCEEKIKELRNSEEIRRLEQEKTKIEKLNNTLEESLRDVREQYRQLDLLDVDKKSLAKKREQRAKEIEGLERSVESNMKKLASFKIEEVSESKLDTHEIDRLEEVLFDFKMQKTRIGGESQSIQEKIEGLQRRQQELNKEEYRRMDFLKRYHADTYNGVLWLRENRHIFKDEIIEPPLLSVELKVPKFSAEVETFLNFQLLSSFICKNSEDFELFLKILKDDKKLAVNAIERIEEKKANTMSNAELASLGFEGMLIDMVEARIEIKDFFNSVAHFNAIPISKSNVDELRIFEKYDIKRMAVRSKFVEIKRSQYNRNDFVISEVGLNTLSLFTQSSADKDLQVMEALRDLDVKRGENKEKYKEIMQKMEEVEVSLAKMYKTRNDHMEKVGEVQRQKTRKEQMELATKRAREQIDALRDTRYLEEEELVMEERIKEDTEIALKKIKRFESLLCDKSFYDKIRVLWKFEKEVGEQNAAIEKEIGMRCVYEEEVGVLGDSLKKLERDKDSKRDELEECKEMLKKHPLNDEEKMVFSTLPDGIEELETAVALESAKLPFYDCDPELERDFIEKEEELNTVHLKLSSLETKTEILDEKVKCLRKECTAKICEFVEPLNKRFSEFFRKFRCEGKVVFAEENLDSSKWKLKIFVKFRETAELEILMGSRQSGGEKSVSTILFLLALQSISPAPFRLVDEINQGMDRQNEKLVHDTLVSLSAPSSPQFFIITPKIVPDLTFCENMKVHIVFAGNFNPLQKSYDNCKYNIVK